jgi:hypothetical protein
MTDTIITNDTKAKIKRLAYYQIIGEASAHSYLFIQSSKVSHQPVTSIFYLQRL